MPIKTVTKGGKTGYKWGSQGKPYFGAGAREKARKQGAAIIINRKR